MTKTIRCILVLTALFTLCLQLSAQAPASDPLPDSPGQLAHTSANSSGRAAGSTYQFPSGRRQFGNYVFSVLGPPGIISAAVGAGLDQRKPEPDEWDSGAAGYGERFGSRYGMRLVSQSTAYTLGAALHQDVTYHRCECRGLLPRTTHAFTSIITARTPSGATRLSIPLIVSPYAGSFTAVYGWYPDHYGASDAARLGSTSFLFRGVGNLVGEFLAPAR
jgi:hypothetical protein